MHVTRSAILPYSDCQLFAMIADIRSYPDFLPGCDAVIIEQEQENQVVAHVSIAYKALKLTFTTQNTMHPYARIDVALKKGPFSKLDAQWQISRLSESAAKVSLSLNFVFTNRVTHALFGQVFELVTNQQFNAFQQRAVELYGETE